MPRAPAQKHIHSSSNAGHPYALPADSNSSDPAPTSSATSIHSPQSQKYFQADQHSQTHMDSLSTSSILYQQGQGQHYRHDDAGPSVKQQSPRDTSHLQAQSSGVKSELNQGKQAHRASQEGITNSTNNSVSPATESSRAQPNGAASPSDPNSASSSASAKTSGQASGGTTTKKKHVCPTCDRAFTTSGHLARHARVHTGERNHKCPFPGCETRCSRQDNLQQHYRIHLSPGSRRSSSSATRAAIRGAIANPTAAPSTISTATAAELDAPPPLAQATFAAAHIAHPVQYASGAHQSYPVPAQTSSLPQSHVPSPHITQQPYPSHTPPIPNGAGHVYENGAGNGLTGADVARGYAHGPPESPSARSGPGSATPSADASPIIGGPGTSSQTYAGQQQTYIYVQHPGYYQSPQHPSPSPQACGSSAAAYSTPPPPASTNLDGQYQPQTQTQAQISTFYQPHHYPREAYIHSATSASPAQATQTLPNYAAQQPLPQQTHDHHQGYAEPPNPKAKSKRRGHATRTTGGGSMVNGAEQSPTDSPAVVTNALQGHAAANGNHRANGQGQSNVYAFYGMAAPPPPSSSASHPPPPPSSGSIGGAPPHPPSSHSGTRYTVTSNGSGFGQFQVHTASPVPPPLTTSSTVTSSSYASPHYGQGMDASNANGTHSPPPVLAPIQTKRPSYHEALPRYSYAQHANGANYASVGKGYSE